MHILRVHSLSLNQKRCDLKSLAITALTIQLTIVEAEKQMNLGQQIKTPPTSPRQAASSCLSQILALGSGLALPNCLTTQELKEALICWNYFSLCCSPAQEWETDCYRELPSENWGWRDQITRLHLQQLATPSWKKKGVCVPGAPPLPAAWQNSCWSPALRSLLPHLQAEAPGSGNISFREKEKEVEFCLCCWLFFPLLLFPGTISQSVSSWSLNALKPRGQLVWLSWLPRCYHPDSLPPEGKSLKTLAKSQPPLQAPLSHWVCLSFTPDRFITYANTCRWLGKWLCKWHLSFSPSQFW